VEGLGTLSPRILAKEFSPVFWKRVTELCKGWKAPSKSPKLCVFFKFHIILFDIRYILQQNFLQVMRRRTPEKVS